jgi:ribonucleoside-diphosphate reductase beta chain
VKKYIRWIANRRLEQLGLKKAYQVDRNPLVWLDSILNAVEHMNFFEGRSTEYSKAATRGTWDEAFKDLKSPYFDMLEKNKIVGEKEFFKPDATS